MYIKRFYAIHCKKFLALFLSLVCLVTAVLSPSIVLADNDSYVFKPEYTKIQGLMDYVMSGVMGVFPGDFNTFYQNNKEAYDKWYEKVYGYNYSGTDHGGGGKKLTVKADDMKELYDLAKSSLDAFDGYFMWWPSGTSARSTLQALGAPSDVISELYSFGFTEPGFIDFTNNTDYKTCNIFSIGEFSNIMFIEFDGSSTVYSVRSYDDYFRDKLTLYRFSKSAGFLLSSYYMSSVFFKHPSDILYFGEHPLRVFYSKQDYLNWVSCKKSDFYISSNFYNYSPKDITINSETVKNYTTNNTTEKIYNETINNINQSGGTSGESGLTQEQVQKIVDDAVKKVLDAMPTPTPESTDTPTPTPTPGTGTGTNTPTPTPTPGGDSGDAPDSSTKEFFQKICNYFEENNKKLEDIIKLLDTAGKSDCNYDYSVLSQFLTTLWNESDKKFDTMISLLEKNNEYQEKMLDSLNQIKALLVVDSVLDVFKDRSTETANKAKEKFPTSVPWDVAMIVNAMSAEPQAPVMKIPLVLEQFNISEEVTIDLSSDEWEKLAKLCRYLLSLLFLLFMVHLTRKLFYKDGDD